VDRVYSRGRGVFELVRTPGDTQRVSIKAGGDPQGTWLWPRWRGDSLVPLCVDLRGTTLVLTERMPIDEYKRAATSKKDPHGPIACRNPSLYATFTGRQLIHIDRMAKNPVPL